MNMSLSNLALLLLPLLPLTVANTPLSDAFVQTAMRTAHGFELAWASRPMWHFGLLSEDKPCYPSAALINGKQHGTNPDLWPHAGTNCADPGPSGRMGNPFPTYFTASFCGADEIRIAYSLYFSHDGFLFGGPADGHMHDWERAIVVLGRASGQWTRKSLLLSSHEGYTQQSWDAVPLTVNYDSKGRMVTGDDRNKDVPMVFVGWAKHALFSNALTAWRDKPSQGCGREYRSADWWYIANPADLVCGADDCPAGKEMAPFNWGSADSGPWTLGGRICAAKEGGTGACAFIDSALPPRDTGTLEMGRKAAAPTAM